MKYFNDVGKAIRVLEYVKQQYKSEHDKFHKFNLDLLNIDTKKDDFSSFFKKIVLMDIQSRPQRLSKYKVLKIFIEIENKLPKIDFKEKFRGDKEGLLRAIYDLTAVKYIGHKISNLIVKNVIYLGDTKRYFGFERNELLPLLKLPVDVHVANLLCYRLQICPVELYDKIRGASGDKTFQEEVKEICDKSKSLVSVDLDILWYVGYYNCSKRIYCPACKIRKYCKDQYFLIETKKNIKDKQRIKTELGYIKTHDREINFN